VTAGSEETGAFLCCLFALRLGNADAYRSCRRVQSDVPLLVPWKALRRQGQASTDSAPGSNISALGAVGSVPPVSTTIGRRGVLDAPALPSPNPTPSVGAALSEAEVEKSIQMGMAMLEQPPRFGPDPTLGGRSLRRVRHLHLRRRRCQDRPQEWVQAPEPKRRQKR
jgi:hypothetical protein